MSESDTAVPMYNKLIYQQWTFVDAAISNGTVVQSQDLASAALSEDTLAAEVRCDDPSIAKFTRKAPMQFYRGAALRGIYYLQSVTRVSPSHYTLSGVTALGLLSSLPHPGGVYTGQTVAQVVSDICGALPVYVKSNLANIKLYGWLPYCKPPESSARDNLAQVLFAIGAYLGVDLDGVLRVEPLWDGVASTIPADRLYQGASVEYGAAVTAVTVTEHQFAPTGGDPTTLFEGTAQAGDVITFDEPMYDLQASGFAILESNANYAKLSAGVGTLTGRPYLHITREITEPVSDAQTPNEQSVTDATLVSLVNATAVARRLAEYYRCRETISSGVVAGDESPGHVVSVYHPYDKTMTTACIMSMDTVLSHILRAETKALVGFRPPQPEDAEYFDERVVLTGTGDFVIPADVTVLTFTLIGGAQGGTAGEKGGDGAQESISWTDENTVVIQRNQGYGYGPGGLGGPGGKGGLGGKILQGTMPVEPGQSYHYACGIGGPGGAFDPETPGEGSQGTDTTFGTHSSATGTAYGGGYTDPVTGERYGGTGEDGIAGGDGSGKASGVVMGSEEWATPTPAGNVTDEDGNVWTGGSYPKEEASHPYISFDVDRASFNGNLDDGSARAYSSAYLGSGAAAGANGAERMDVSGGKVVARKLTGPPIYLSVRAYSLPGLPGADAAIVPKKPKVYGKGGRGGYGGGGGSSPGYAFIGITGNPIGRIDKYLYPADVGVGGKGSEGGEGADGCIILYYRRPAPKQARGPIVTSKGKWFLDKLGRRFIV